MRKKVRRTREILDQMTAPRNQFAMNVIQENVILRPRDVIEMVKRKIDLTEREKKSLRSFPKSPGFLKKRVGSCFVRGVIGKHPVHWLNPPAFCKSPGFSKRPDRLTNSK